MYNTIRINKISKNPSLCDGPGYRTVIFLQGCLFKCKGCHNEKTWNVEKGIVIKIEDLICEINKVCHNKKITISGGEPLLQINALIILLENLKGFDICLYTGYEIEEVPKELLKFLKYIKVGKFIFKERTSTIPYIGSSNQRFIEVKKWKNQ